MAHYDCKDCGAMYGIEWGLCESCTPQEYLDLRTAINKARTTAENEWEYETRDAREEYINKYMETSAGEMIDRMNQMRKEKPRRKGSN